MWCGARIDPRSRTGEGSAAWLWARGSGEGDEKFVVLRAVCCLSFVHDCTRHADPPLSAAATAGTARTRTQRRRGKREEGREGSNEEERERRAPAIAAASRHAVRRHRFFFFGVCRCAHALWSGCAVGEGGQRRPSGCSTGKRDAARPPTRAHPPESPRRM